MGRRIIYFIELAANIKNDYLELLDRLINYIKKKSTSESLHEYVRVIRDKVEQENSEKIAITHKDFEYVHENYGKENKSDSLSGTNKKKFNSIRDHIDNFNKTELKNSKYQLIRKDIITITIQEKSKTPPSEKLVNHDRNKSYTKNNKLISESLQFINNILFALKNLFLKPKKLLSMELSNKYWILIFCFLLLAIILLFLAFIKSYALFTMDNKIDDLVMSSNQAIDKFKLWYLIKKRDDFAGYGYTVLKYIKDLLWFMGFNYVIYYLVLRLFRSSIIFGQLLFVNTVLITLFLSITQLISLIYSAIGGISLSTLNWTIYILLSILLLLQSRALYYLSGLRLFKFILAFCTMNVLLIIYGFSMAIFKILTTGRVI